MNSLVNLEKFQFEMNWLIENEYSDSAYSLNFKRNFRSKNTKYFYKNLLKSVLGLDLNSGNVKCQTFNRF